MAVAEPGRARTLARGALGVAIATLADVRCCEPEEKAREMLPLAETGGPVVEDREFVRESDGRELGPLLLPLSREFRRDRGGAGSPERTKDGIW
jgi:hypothetical protein